MKKLDALLAKKKLILFDIDGTLVYLIELHCEIFSKAFFKYTQVKIKSYKQIYKHFGLPIQETTENILKDLKIHYTDKLITKIVNEREKRIVKLKNKISPKNVLPGVILLLKKLRKEKKLLMTITGNQKKAGEQLLQRSKLMGYFSDYVYADDYYRGKPIEKRHELVLEAIRRAKKIIPNLEKSEVLVVGDMIPDITAAREAGVDSLGIATGPQTLSKIKTAKPTLAIKSLK